MTARGIVLLDTIIGLSIITVTLLMSSHIMQQALLTARTLNTIRNTYFEACNDAAQFRQHGTAELGTISTTPHGDFYTLSILGDIYFEALH